jgi:hypothetical protein
MLSRSMGSCRSGAKIEGLVRLLIMSTTIPMQEGAPTAYDEYTIVRTPHGVLIRGTVPVNDLVALTKGFEEQGFTQMDPGIATAEKATIALTSEAGGKAWREEIETRNATLNEELAWLNGYDTGTSSLTIFSVMSREHGKGALRRDKADVPHDPDDFGRCHRLLEKFPAWRVRMHEVADRYPNWGPLVGAWDELTALYVKELPSGSAPRLYAQMKALRGTR